MRGYENERKSRIQYFVKQKTPYFNISGQELNFITVDELFEQVREHYKRVSVAEDLSLKRFSKNETKISTDRNHIVMLWIRARRLRLEAVWEIDSVIEPLNLGLSVADDVSHDGLAGSVEVRLHRLDGGLPRSLLDIEIDLQGRHRIAVFDTRFPP